MKKIISILLSFAVLLSILGSSTSYANDFISQNEKDKFVNNVRFLETIGVLDKEKRKNIEDTVTRAELAGILARIDKQNTFLLNEEITFNDVSDEEQQKYIAKAISMGVMSATEEGYFSPERTVITTEAICAIVRLIGYNWLAGEKGGFPNGYIYVAQDTKMLKNVDLNIGYPITYYSLINLIMNAVNIDFFGKVLGSVDATYSVMEGRNIMSDWWKLEEKFGVITSNNVTSLTQTTPAPSGRIGIEGVMYPVSGDFNDLLGHYIKYYYDVEEEKVVYIDALEDKNDIITISADSVIDFRDRIFKYGDESNSIEKLELEDSIDVICNGSALIRYEDADLMPSEGNITFIDNNRNGKYDVVVVNGYQTVVVYSIDTENHIIYDKFNNSRNFDCSDCDEENIHIVDAEGNKLNFDELHIGDVLSVSKSRNNAVANIIVSRAHIEGKAENYDSHENVIRINGKEYETVSGYFDFSANFSFDYGTYYLNNDNKIVAFSSLAGDQYGYLVSGREREEGEWLELKIFDNSGKMLKFKCAEKVKIDGIQKKKDIVYIQNILKKGETEILPQLIQYKLDENGEINYIDTPYNNKLADRRLDDMTAPYRTVSPEAPEKEDSLRLTYASNGIEYRYDQRTLGGKVFISDNTFFFSVPQDISTASDDDFGVVSYTYLNSGDYYRFDSYARAEDPLTADVIVLVGMGAGSKSRTGVVSSIKSAVKDDDVGYSIEILSKHGKDVVWVDDVNLIENAPAQDENDTNTYKVAVGDVVYIQTNAQQKVKSVKLMIDASEQNPDSAVKMPANPSSTSFTANDKVIYGSVYSKYNGIVSVTTDSLPTDNRKVNPTYQEPYNLSQFAIYRVKKDVRIEVERVSIAEVMDYVHCGQGYSKMAVLTSNAIPMLAIIYE